MATVGAINLMINANASGVTRGVAVARGALLSLQNIVPAATGAMAGLTAQIMKSVNAFAEQEQAIAKLEVLLGSQSKAVQKFSQLQQLASSSPLSMNDMLQSSSTLLSFGMDSQKLLPIMRQLSDVSLGNAERFQSLSLAMAQVSAAGRLQGQDLLQLVNAGFNPLQIISENTGVSMIDLKKRMEEGSISIKMVEEAFRLATSEGGRFENGTSRMADTVSGKIAKAVDVTYQWHAALGALYSPEVKAGLGWFNETMDRLLIGANYLVQTKVNNLDSTAAAFAAIEFGNVNPKDAEENLRKQQEKSALLVKELEKADALKKSKEAMEAMHRQTKEAERLAEMYERQASAIREQLDPILRVQREVRGIYALVGVGALDSATAQRAIKKITSDAASSTAIGFAPTLRPGSGEAAKAVAQKQLDAQNQQLKAQEEARIAQQATLELMREGNKLLGKLQTIGLLN
jgi:tape measure domain-containing protein